MTLLADDEVAEAYAELAPHYDLLTASYDYDGWLAGLEALAFSRGLAGDRVLDVACGTGKSFLPLVRRGYRVVGCDISEEMLAIARQHAGDEVHLFRADVRHLPATGPFDLVTWLDDATNYLLGDDDLNLAIASIAGVLAPDGLLIFDCNSKASHDDAFRSPFVAEREDVFLCWHPLQSPADHPQGIGSATVEIFESQGPDCWSRRRSEHRQRWWGEEDVRGACEQAGLRLIEMRGQYQGGVLDTTADELVHNKIVYVAKRPRHGS